jgi:proteic killer suppression protein
MSVDAVVSREARPPSRPLLKTVGDGHNQAEDTDDRRQTGVSISPLPLPTDHFTLCADLTFSFSPVAGLLAFRQSFPICLQMIQSFSDRDTEELFQTESNRRFAAIARVALRKLIQMNQAGRLDDLSVPPGNRLELLKGRLAGFHSIRVNDQWRIIFRWTDAGPSDVAIVITIDARP